MSLGFVSSVLTSVFLLINFDNKWSRNETGSSKPTSFGILPYLRHVLSFPCHHFVVNIRWLLQWKLAQSFCPMRVEPMDDRSDGAPVLLDRSPNAVVVLCSANWSKSLDNPVLKDKEVLVRLSFRLVCMRSRHHLLVQNIRVTLKWRPGLLMPSCVTLKHLALKIQSSYLNRLSQHHHSIPLFLCNLGTVHQYSVFWHDTSPLMLQNELSCVRILLSVPPLLHGSWTRPKPVASAIFSIPCSERPLPQVLFLLSVWESVCAPSWSLFLTLCCSFFFYDSMILLWSCSERE